MGHGLYPRQLRGLHLYQEIFRNTSHNWPALEIIIIMMMMMMMMTMMIIITMIIIITIIIIMGYAKSGGDSGCWRNFGSNS